MNRHIYVPKIATSRSYQSPLVAYASVWVIFMPVNAFTCVLNSGYDDNSITPTLLAALECQHVAHMRPNICIIKWKHWLKFNFALNAKKKNQWKNAAFYRLAFTLCLSLLSYSLYSSSTGHYFNFKSVIEWWIDFLKWFFTGWAILIYHTHTHNHENFRHLLANGSI